MGTTASKLMSIEEFFAWQEKQDERYELIDGVPVLHRGMAGAREAHDDVVVNAIVALGSRLRGKPCRTRTSDSSIVTAIRRIRRPDVMVDCGPRDPDSLVAQKPVVAIEVLSPSTNRIDRFTKLEEYRRLQSLRHILLIDPDSVSAKLYSRAEGGEWMDVDIEDPAGLIELSAIAVSFPLGELYVGLPFAQPSPSTSSIE